MLPGFSILVLSDRFMYIGGLGSKGKNLFIRHREAPERGCGDPEKNWIAARPLVARNDEGCGDDGGKVECSFVDIVFFLVS